MIATRNTLHVVKRAEARHIKAEFPRSQRCQDPPLVFGGSRLDIREQNPETALKQLPAEAGGLSCGILRVIFHGPFVMHGGH